jgi:UDP-glucuronate decarboxylase
MMHSAEEVVGPVNLGNPGEFTMNELARLVGAKVGVAVQTVHQPLPADDPKLRQPIIDKARKLLGWDPRVALAEGLDRTIEYFRGVLT